MNKTTKRVKKARKQHRVIERAYQNCKDQKQNEKLFENLTSKPNSTYTTIRNARKSSSIQVPYIAVGNKKYYDEKVIDGLFESISKLKTLNMKHFISSPYHQSLMEDYKNIKLLCSDNFDIPPISLKDSTSLLK